jgi:hypothetical protein
VKVDLIKLKEEIDGGWINVQKHPQHEIFIAKYSKSSVFSQRWNDITTICRGICYDSLGNVVINSIPKFWNSFQGQALPIMERNKGLSYEIFNKMDGSLLQVAKWNGHLIVSSSGSFSSPQVHKAAEMLLTRFKHYNFEDGWSYIFEIIFKNNRIVINYGDLESLALLAVRNTETGEEMSYDDMLIKFNGWDIVERMGKTMEEVGAELSRPDFCNREGYVLRWSNGERVKFKLEKYMELHKVISGISEKWVWEVMSSGLNYRDSAVEIPDELDDWIKETAAKFQRTFDERLHFVHSLYEEVSAVSSERKVQAQYVLSKHKPNARFVFGLLDGKDISHMIWQSLEPKGGPNGSMRWGAGAGVDEE